MRLGVNLTDDAGQMLEALVQRTDNLQPALRDMADILRTRERRVFGTDGAAGGVRWPELSERTLTRKSGGDILRDRDLLYRSLTQRGARYSVEKLTADSLLFGTKNPVANLLRGGTKRMPARHPVPPVTTSERGMLTASLITYLTEGRS